MPKDRATLLKAIVTMDELEALRAKETELRGELRRSLLIMLVAPAANFQGKVRTKVRGPMFYSHLHGGDMPKRETEFVITDADGVEHVTPLFEVPTDLWPNKEATLRWLKRSQPMLHKRILEREEQMFQEARDAAAAAK